MEIAYVSSNKVYLGVERQQTALTSKILSKLTENPVQFVTSMLIGNSIVLVIYSYYMSNVVMRYIAYLGWSIPSFYNTLLQIVISLFVILITAKFLPKVFFQVYANTLIKFFAIPAYIFHFIFYWVSYFVIAITDFILVKVLRTKGGSEQPYFTRGELGNYITEQMDGIDSQEEMDSEIQIFQNALEFSDLKAREVMTPRTEIAAVDLNDTIEELKELFVETGYSKIIVYKETLDNVIGYVHSFELFKRSGSTIKEMMLPIEYAPETIYIKELLNILTRKHKSIAVILDEYGGTSGIITVEDIIEELFGEIEDEHDDEGELVEKDLGDCKYLFSARLDVEYVNEKYGLNLPESDSYATLGGFVVHNTKEIPKQGGKIKAEGYEITIEEASNKKIEIIKITPLQEK
ncbi:hemolysin [Flavobacterium suaedae]|uniref:Hemolysin n=2 Tax=Flavobacterium suaedae TaxID=1767027 RepID=A0ABQ1JN24_9FLAO|nr:hemolysin [Flavobacterium suaedae]